MIVDHVEASLRYPMDFTYHIQNFSAVVYEKVSLQGLLWVIVYKRNLRKSNKTFLII